MLRVWLPLNGDLRNQGLGEITSSGTPVFKNIGKMGNKSLDLSSRVTFNCNSLSNLKTFSIAFWAKINSDTSLSTNWVDVISFADKKSDGSVSGLLRWESCYGSNYTNWGISSHDNGNYNISSLGSFQATYKNTWHHIIMTVDLENNAVKEYHNGILKVTSTCNGGYLVGNFHIGENNLINGEMNDLRIYDHALSAKEVSELAKGLVLHYRLSGVGGENLAKGTNEAHSEGLNKGYNLSSMIPNGTKVTISCRIDADNVVLTGNKRIGLSISIIKADGSGTQWFEAWIYERDLSNGSFHGRISNTSIVLGNMNSIYAYIQTLSSGTVSISQVKVEIGDHPTPWSPAPSDPEYSTMGLDDGIEYDTSGFQNNGTKTGTITWNSDSARYNSCYEMTGTSYINCGKPYDYIVDGSEEFTVNIWAYKDTWDTSTQIYSCTESGGFSLSTGNNSVTCYCHVYGASSVLTNSSGETITNSRGDPILLSTSASYITFTQSYTLNTGWHMFTMVYTKEGLKLYVDGSLARNMSSSSVGLHYNKNCNLYIGAEATGAGGCSSPYLNGKASDLRIFATALSDSDILALYNLGGSLDSNGTFHTYEYVEV